MAATSSPPVAPMRASRSPPATRSAVAAARLRRSDMRPASATPTTAPASAAASAAPISLVRRSFSDCCSAWNEARTYSGVPSAAGRPAQITGLPFQSPR